MHNESLFLTRLSLTGFTKPKICFTLSSTKLRNATPVINKQQLIDKVTDSTRLARKDVEETINTFLDLIIDKLSLDDKVNLTGFGSFEVRERKGRAGVNPRQPSQHIQIPTVRVAKFRPGKTLKESVK